MRPCVLSSWKTVLILVSCFLCLCLAPSTVQGQERERGTIRGTVTDAETGEALAGATVVVEDQGTGTSTDGEGRYELRIPPGTYTLVFKFVGYARLRRAVDLDRKATVDVELKPERLNLAEVVVTDRATENRVQTVSTGKTRLDPAKLERLPTFMGSPDIMRGLLAKPGVGSVSEGAAGFNVRGGDVGQNLILFNDTPVYFPSHLFGLFSPFNAATVSDVTLNKSSLPAKYGGRVSSVLRVDQKVGNREEYHLRGGVSPITSRLFVEGPIHEGTTSFVAGGRLSYVNWLLNATGNSDLENSQASFYDVNLGVNHRFGASNELDAIGYRASDDVSLVDTTFTYATSNASLAWNHLFTDRLFMDVRGTIAQYDFTIRDREPSNAFVLDSRVRTFKISSDLAWNPNDRHQFNAGLEAKYHDINPGRLRPDGPASQINPLQIEEEYGLESAAYLSDRINLTNNLRAEVGLRLSMYNQFGPARTPVFEEGAPREPRSIIDTAATGRGETAVTYVGLEPRISVRYALSEDNSVKFSYDRTRQHLHLLSNSTAVAPTDVWHLSSRYRKPQIGDQVSVGYFQNFGEGAVTSSVEVFYKWIDNVPAFEPGTEPLLNENLSADLLSGVGRAYGLEFLARKTGGRYKGRVSYTYSRSLRKVTGPTSQERINGGDWYPSNHDRPHELTARFTYVGEDPRAQWNFKFVYRTGRAITFPSSKFKIGGFTVANVSGINQARVPDYHRLDLSLRIDLERRSKRGWNGSWTFSLYNAYAHRNISSVFFGRGENGTPQAYSRSVFGTALPSLTYTFEY